MEEWLAELLPSIVSGLQKTPAPDILVAGGLFFLLVSIIGIFEKQDISLSKTRAARFCGSSFLLIGIFLLEGIPNYPLCIYAQPLGWQYVLMLMSQKLAATLVPTFFTLGAVTLIGVSSIGIFGGRTIRNSRRKAGIFFGLLILFLGIFLYIEPTLPLNSTRLEETLNVSFSGGKEGIKTCESYEGLTTIIISGTALTSVYDDVDAFYLYSKSPHKHLTNLTLWINGKPIDNFVHSLKTKIPYSDSHTYKFIIKVPKGNIIFGVGDGLAVNKDGSFAITVFQGTS